MNTLDKAKECFVGEMNAGSVSEAIRSRRSIRAFTAKAVDQSMLQDILNTAARAPSGTNIQPWQVYVVAGDTRDKLCNVVCHAFDNHAAEHNSEVPYYPPRWFEPYLARRRKIGWDLYGLLGIEKGEREKTHAQHRAQFSFF